MSEHKPRVYMNAGAQRMMQKAFELMDEMRATGRKDLVGEICSLCGYEGVAEQHHTCPSSGWYPDEEAAFSAAAMIDPELLAAYNSLCDQLAKRGIIDHSITADILSGLTLEEHIRRVIREEDEEGEA